jgi:hypothetical protein
VDAVLHGLVIPERRPATGEVNNAERREAVAGARPFLVAVA